MNLELTAPPRPTTSAIAPDASPEPEPKVESQPFFDPLRNALLASAYQNLAEAALRIDRLEMRLKSLPTRSAGTL